MSKTRTINFATGNDLLTFDFGTYALIMYFAKDIDPTNAKKMFYATLDEFYYQLAINQSVENLSDNELAVHFNPQELHEVITFIDNAIIPALEKETDLISKYGGMKSFNNLFYQNQDYLIAINIYDGEYYSTDVGQIINLVNGMKSFFQRALDSNEPYFVYPG